MKLIDKEALVAEIEGLKKTEGWCQVSKDTAEVYYARGFRFACERITYFLDTLEVKEVDLKKEVERFVQTKEFIESTESPAIVIARHFFELGLIANQEK